jgi:hypothetical protein
MDGNIIGAIGLYQKYFMESERMFATLVSHDGKISHLVVLWRIPDFIQNLRWGGLSTWMAGLGQIYISMYSNTDIVHKK